MRWTSRKAFLRDECGQASIFEMSILMPLATMIVLALFFLGFYMLQTVDIETRASQMSNRIAYAWTRPGLRENLQDLTTADKNDIASVYEALDPYRYLFGGLSEEVIDRESSLAETSIRQTSPFRLPSMHIHTETRGIVFPIVRVEMRLETKFPVLSRFLDRAMSARVRESSVVDNTSFLRNLQFADAVFHDVMDVADHTPLSHIANLIELAKTWLGR